MKLLRAVAVLHAAAVCAQPLLAGLYLNGDGSAIPIHESVGLTAAALCLVQLALTGRDPGSEQQGRKGLRRTKAGRS